MYTPMFTPTVNFDTVAKHLENIYNWMKLQKIVVFNIFEFIYLSYNNSVVSLVM